MVFSVSCPECSSEFPVDSAKVPEGGVLAQCSECPGTFLVEQPEPQSAQEEGPDSTAWLEAVGADTEAVEHQEDESSPWLAASEDGPSGQADPVGDDAIEILPAPEAAADAAEPQAEAQEVSAEPQTATATAPAFGQSDPDARAARLARVLVSDMMTYNPALYEKAMEAGTLAEDFEDEVKKSWSEYVDQVGEDVARSTAHFTRALNDILAKGEDVFQESMYE
jgi:predicted Zn finger-like uncharacterized protein